MATHAVPPDIQPSSLQVHRSHSEPPPSHQPDPLDPMNLNTQILVALSTLFLILNSPVLLLTPFRARRIPRRNPGEPDPGVYPPPPGAPRKPRLRTLPPLSCSARPRTALRTRFFHPQWARSTRTDCLNPPPRYCTSSKRARNYPGTLETLSTDFRTSNLPSPNATPASTRPTTSCKRTTRSR